MVAAALVAANFYYWNWWGAETNSKTFVSASVSLVLCYIKRHYIYFVNYKGNYHHNDKPYKREKELIKLNFGL